MKKVKNRNQVTLVPPAEACRNCGDHVVIMAFRGLGWCSDDCRKALGLGPKETRRGTAGL